MHKAQIGTRLLYESDYAAVRTEDVLLALDGDPRLKRCARAELLGTPAVKLAAAHGLAKSNGTEATTFLRFENDVLKRLLGAAKDLVKSKGLYVNKDIVPDAGHLIGEQDLLDDQFVILSAGAKKQIVLVASEA